ncbi:MAG: hypothetical protein GWP18_01465, partial [Proteobacteria bacterium]|nr:hypothetical protein [Pseudomonadota bacterium]
RGKKVNQGASNSIISRFFHQNRFLVSALNQLADQIVSIQFFARQYDPQLGARPLRRAIQRLLEDPLSEKVLFKEFSAGSTVLVSVDSEDADSLAFEAVETPDKPLVELAEN